MNPYRFGGNFMAASGGTETIDGDYKIHTFTTSGSFIVSKGGELSQVLVIAGGGAGSADNYGVRAW